MTVMQMYWLTRLDYICNFFNTIAVLGIGGTIIGVFGMVIFSSRYEENEYRDFKKVFQWSILPAILAGLFCVAIPTTKEMAAILVVPKIVNNQKVQAMPDKVLDLANAWLEKLKPAEK